MFQINWEQPQYNLDALKTLQTDIRFTGGIIMELILSTTPANNTWKYSYLPVKT